MIDYEIKKFKYFNGDGDVTVWYVPDSLIGEPTKENIGKFIWHHPTEPAFVGTEAIEYWQDNMWHRYDGPAYYDISLSATTLTDNSYWYLYDKGIDKDEYTQWLLDMGMDMCNLSDEDKVLIKVKYGSD